MLEQGLPKGTCLNINFPLLKEERGKEERGKGKVERGKRRVERGKRRAERGKRKVASAM